MKLEPNIYSLNSSDRSAGPVVKEEKLPTEDIEVKVMFGQDSGSSVSSTVSVSQDRQTTSNAADASSEFSIEEVLKKYLLKRKMDARSEDKTASKHKKAAAKPKFPLHDGTHSKNQLSEKKRKAQYQLLSKPAAQQKPGIDSESSTKSTVSSKSAKSITGSLSGPKCIKCEFVCKNMAHLKIHVLSHFYPAFSAILPKERPFKCSGKEIKINGNLGTID